MSASSQYVRPRELAEALELRAKHPDWMVLAGGTDLMVNANHRPVPAGILDLWRFAPICFIRNDDKTITLGAGTTFSEIQVMGLDRLKSCHSLVAAAREVGALQIQARGTIGGNVGTSSPVGDSLPVLLALDAELEVASVRGTRKVPYHEWCTGYRTTKLAADELITAVHLPIKDVKTRPDRWRKVGTRRAQSISKVMGAAAFTLADGHIRDARVALGAVANRPLRLTAVEKAVEGQPVARAADAARAAMRGTITPIDDIRSTAKYRYEVAENLVARFFSGIIS